jgi:lipoate-protein ligase A
MKYIDLTLPSPAANLACDEALLELCEAGHEDGILRFWESAEHFVVVGYANCAATEVNLEACRTENIPVLRRLSGGGTVLQGPGCLNYSVILNIAESGPLATITGTNQFVLTKQKAAMESLLGREVKIEGQTDLALGDLKFSGNAQRRKRRFLIFHGTILLNFEIPLIEKYLRMPSKEPDYRANRRHREFLINLHLDSRVVKEAIRNVWQATQKLSQVPLEEINALCGAKYSSDAWNLKV